jgi:hypothetical protein
VEVPGLDSTMDALGALADGAAAEAALSPLVAGYRAWIDARRAGIATLEGTRRETAEELLRLAAVAADRIERGIACLARDADALDAFRVANRAVARALGKRLGVEKPRWRAFQLAFLLLNLPGDGAEAPAPSGGAGARRLRARARAREGRRALRDLALRDRALGGQGRHAQPDGAAHGSGPTRSHCFRTTTSRASCASSARASSASSRAIARFPSSPWTSRSTAGSRRS